MRLTFVIPALAVATTLAAPADAQYDRGYGYHGSGYYGPADRTRVYRHVYEGPAIGPLFYGDGWVPEPIFDHSRTGGVDPNIRPPS